MRKKMFIYCLEKVLFILQMRVRKTMYTSVFKFFPAFCLCLESLKSQLQKHFEGIKDLY